METVMLNDGSIEIVGSHRDLVDIVRDRCGDDIAKMVENLDPAVYDSLYRAFEKDVDNQSIIMYSININKHNL